MIDIKNNFMRVSSTKFQQQVGYYLSLADQGEEIIIEKQKPKNVSYVLKRKDAKPQLTMKEIVAKLDKIKVKDIGFGMHDSVKYQRKVRS